MKKIALVLFAFTLIFSSCKKEPKFNNVYLISTELGDIKIRLYDETPLHRDNFEKLVSQEYFDGILFHRVIENFMIQGGDPNSKNAQPEVMLGDGGPGYKIPAEFVDTIFHKKGVLAAAREGDDVNPEKNSSGSQFYIVQGKVFTDEELDKIELRIKGMMAYSKKGKYLEEEKNKAMDVGETPDFEKLVPLVDKRIENELEESQAYKIPEYKREIYRTLGGTPHLDGSYTIFGEVIEGLDVLDKIAASETNDCSLASSRVCLLMILLPTFLYRSMSLSSSSSIELITSDN